MSGNSSVIVRCASDIGQAFDDVGVITANVAIDDLSDCINGWFRLQMSGRNFLLETGGTERFPMWQHCGIRIFILERDVYARQAIASYFCWDRRTHVVGSSASLGEMITALNEEQDGFRLDVVTLNTDAVASAAELASLIKLIQHYAHGARVVCLSTHLDLEWMKLARQAGACAYMTREVVDLGVASAVWYAISHDFTVTEDIAHQIEVQAFADACGISTLPGRRHYERLTPRIEQALWLCVVEGLPAELAAEEMGVSVSTVRSYIKEGYRILESEDDTPFPISVSPAERAFLRFTALEEPEVPWRPAA